MGLQPLQVMNCGKQSATQSIAGFDLGVTQTAVSLTGQVLMTERAAQLTLDHENSSLDSNLCISDRKNSIYMRLTKQFPSKRDRRVLKPILASDGLSPRH